jgi:hypothetical protein
MNGPKLLQEHVGVIKSRMGAFFPGSHVMFRGHELHADLKDMDWLELYVFGITGRRFSPEQLRLMHSMWTYTSYPDARIWNNRVAALAGSARSTGNLGLAAALAISEASIYGGGILVRAIGFFIRTKNATDGGESLVECIKKELNGYRSVAGYGRPIVNGDERIQPLLSLAKELSLDQGHYLKQSFAIEDVLLQGRWRLKMNYAALVAALGADLGLNPKEFHLFMFPVFLAGIPPCYIEASEKSIGALFPEPCQSIAYRGLGQRDWGVSIMGNY